MSTGPSVSLSRLGLRQIFCARALLPVLALAALAASPAARANPFAATSLSPSNQTVNVGEPCSVNIVFAVGTTSAYGIAAWLNYDATKLQVVSVTTSGSSPYTNVTTNTFDNTLGKLQYQATGGSVGGTFTVATIVFMPIASGSASLTFSNVNEYLTGYGPYGVNGLAVGGSITVNAPPPAPTQTLTILGGVGNAGDIAPNTEYYNPATRNWQPAYLTGGHPWGFVAGTNSWINYKTNTASDPGAGPTTANTLWYLYRVRINVPADAQNPQMTFSVKADNFADIAVNGVSVGPVIDGTADNQNADLVFSQNLVPGENFITLDIGDWGGLNGFNYRLDLTVESNDPLEIIPPDPVDTVPPVITAPADIISEATSAAGAVVTFTATAVDNVDGPVPVMAIPASGSTFPLSTTLVVLGAHDAANNASAASFHVKVQDTIAPALTVPANQVLEATDATGTVATFSAITSDAVGVTSTTYSTASGSTFPIGTSTVTVTASDAAGNATSGSFTVTVRDTTAPALTVPTNQVLEATGPAGATASFTASATDAVGVTSLTYSTASGSPFPIGTSTVTMTARDAAGNATSGSFTVTVRDTTTPVINGVTPSTATLWPPNHQMVPISIVANASDLVGITSLKIISVQSSEPDNGLGDGDTANDTQISGALTVNLRAERSGNGNGRTYTITVEAKDAAGNTSTKTTTVSVLKSQGGKK